MEDKKTIFVDSHVHIYDCFNINEFFEFAVNNFIKIHNQLGLTEKLIGVLFFTESGETNYFKQISDNRAYYSDLLKFGFELTSEEDSIRIVLNSGNYLILIAGRQIVTKENLEVHAIGTIEKFEYGKDFLSIINLIKEKKAIPVIPWGVGKWFGRRGKVVENIVQNSSGIFLGDNSGRPKFWVAPKLFSEGIKKKLYTLRGTDPLPLKYQEKKAGSFGFYFISVLDLERPSEFLKKYLWSLEKQPTNYGELESIFNFVKDQFLMQLNKLIKKAS